MKIGLIDVDSHNFPNLALMKLSAWHKQNGDDVEMWNGFFHYDKPNAPKETKQIQRWVNNKFIWRTCDRFENYGGNKNA